MGYRGGDELDIKLLSKLGKFIIFQRLDVVALKLGFTAAEFSRIIASKKSDEMIFQVHVIVSRWLILDSPCSDKVKCTGKSQSHSIITLFKELLTCNSKLKTYIFLAT